MTIDEGIELVAEELYKHISRFSGNSEVLLYDVGFVGEWSYYLEMRQISETQIQIVAWRGCESFFILVAPLSEAETVFQVARQQLERQYLTDLVSRTP